MMLLSLSLCLPSAHTIQEFFTVARDAGIIPDISLDPVLTTFLSLDSSAALQHQYSALHRSMSAEQQRAFNLHLSAECGGRSISYGGVGVVALALSMIFDQIAQHIRTKGLTQANPSSQRISSRKIFGISSTSNIGWIIQSYLQLVPGIANNPEKMAETTELYDTWLKLELIDHYQRMSNKKRMSSVSMQQWLVGAALHLHMRIHQVRIGSVPLGSAEALRLSYRTGLSHLLQGYKVYLRKNIQVTALPVPFRSSTANRATITTANMCQMNMICSSNVSLVNCSCSSNVSLVNCSCSSNVSLVNCSCSSNVSLVNCSCSSNVSLVNCSCSSNVSLVNCSCSSNVSLVNCSCSSNVSLVNCSCSSNVSLVNCSCSSNVSLVNCSCSSNVSLVNCSCSSNVSLVNCSCSSNVSLVNCSCSSNVSLVNCSCSSNVSLVNCSCSSNVSLMNCSTVTHDENASLSSTGRSESVQTLGRTTQDGSTVSKEPRTQGLLVIEPLRNVSHRVVHHPCESPAIEQALVTRVFHAQDVERNRNFFLFSDKVFLSLIRQRNEFELRSV